MKVSLTFNVCIVLVTLTVPVEVARCHQCTWDAIHESQHSDVSSLALFNVQRYGTYDARSRPKEIVLESPFTMPFLDKRDSQEPPNKDFLEDKCFVCSVEGGVCVKWTFTDNGSPLNITWMCIRSVERIGCYRQETTSGVEKEVCLCEDDFCNVSTKLGPKGFMNFLVFVVIRFLY